jgi:hypothetical protein
VGAAFIMTFLNKMLECGIDRALYLVTTDGNEQGKDGKSKDVWGWPSLFVNPKVFGKAYPKAPFHVFEMISRLEGSRVEATRGEDGINCIASADPKKKRITLIIWNYNSIMSEQGVPVELTSQISQIVRIREATAFFGSRAVHMKRWLVSETLSNAYDLFVKEGKVDGRSELQQVDEGQFAILNDQCDFGFSMPPSSVAFVTLEAQE